MYQHKMNSILRELLQWHLDPSIMQETCDGASKGERTVNDAMTIFVTVIETNNKGVKS